MNGVTAARIRDSDWQGLFRAGGLAALLAGIVFRRNLAAEIGLLSQRDSPATVSDSFALLQDNRLLGLAFLNLFDIANCVRVALMLVALCAALWQANKGLMAMSTTLGLVGIAVSVATTPALSMLSLSEQHAAATSEPERTMLLAAGEAMLALGRFTGPGAQPGTGGYVALLLIAVAGLITSAVMLRSDVFGPVTAGVGVLAGGLDLAYCLAIAFLPAADGEMLAILFIPAAGLLWMVWHVLVGWRLLRPGKGPRRVGRKDSAVRERVDAND